MSKPIAEIKVAAGADGTLTVVYTPLDIDHSTKPNMRIGYADYIAEMSGRVNEMIHGILTQTALVPGMRKVAFTLILDDEGMVAPESDDV